MSAINYTFNNSSRAEHSWRATDDVCPETVDFRREADSEKKYTDSWQLSNFCYPVIIVTPSPPTCQVFTDTVFEKDAYRVPDFSRKIKIVNIFQVDGATTKTDDVAPVDNLKPEAETERKSGAPELNDPWQLSEFALPVINATPRCQIVHLDHTIFGEDSYRKKYSDSWQLSNFCYPVIIVTPSPPTCQVFTDTVFEKEAYRVPDFSRKIKIVNIFQVDRATTKTDDVAPVDNLKPEAETERKSGALELNDPWQLSKYTLPVINATPHRPTYQIVDLDQTIFDEDAYRVPDYSQKAIKIVNISKADEAVTKTDKRMKEKKKKRILTRMANLFLRCMGKRKSPAEEYHPD